MCKLSKDYRRSMVKVKIYNTVVAVEFITGSWLPSAVWYFQLITRWWCRPSQGLRNIPGFCRQGSKSLRCGQDIRSLDRWHSSPTGSGHRLHSQVHTQGWLSRLMLCVEGVAPSHPPFPSLLCCDYSSLCRKCAPSLRNTCKHSLMPNYFKTVYFQNGSQH